MLNKEFGGSVMKKDIREDGQFKITVETSSALFRGLQSEQEVLLTHGDSIDRVASGLKIIARSGDLVAGTAVTVQCCKFDTLHVYMSHKMYQVKLDSFTHESHMIVFLNCFFYILQALRTNHVSYMEYSFTQK